MNFLDFLILIPVAWFGFKGFKNGLINELASILALVLGVWVTIKFSDFVAVKLGDIPAVKAVAFILTFLAVLVGVYFAGKLVERIVKLMIPAFLNNVFGLLFGVAKTMVVISVIFYFINIVDFKQIIIKPETKQQSMLYKYTEPVVPMIVGKFEKEKEEIKPIASNPES